MSSSNSMALLERTSLNVYGADIFNCSRQLNAFVGIIAAAFEKTPERSR